MRFKRSIKLSAKTGGTAGVAERVRRRRLRRLVSWRGVVITALVLGAAGYAVMDRALLAADGVVAGDLTAVSPIAQVRLTRLHAQCLDRVREGDMLAELENEVTMQSAAQALSQLHLQASQALSRIEILTHEAQAAEKLYHAQLALRDRLEMTYRAQDQLVKKEHVAALVWERAKSDLIRADAEAQAANLTHQSKLADLKKTELDVEMLRERIKEFETSPELMGRFVLRAPKAGVLTQCQGRVGEVIEARSSLFSIFDSSEAYALAFFRTDDVGRLKPGLDLTLSVAGMEGPVTGRVTGVYPEMSGLPQSITRYFWQQERWSQYAAVRIDLVGLSSEMRQGLRSGARIRASVWQRPSFVSPEAWAWIQEKATQLAEHSKLFALNT
jgi:multidrug resistance efflux pump